MASNSTHPGIHFRLELSCDDYSTQTKIVLSVASG